MNKIVRKNYPVERLPADLQSGLPKQSHVDIEMKLAATDVRPITSLIGSGRNIHGDVASVLKHVRTLRDDR